MSVARGDDSATEWLLRSPEPAIRRMAARDLLLNAEVEPAAPPGPITKALLHDHGGHPYRKWTGAHWRLVALADLEAPPEHPRVRTAADQVPSWLTSDDHRRGIPLIDGLTRAHASMEGNALSACCRLGLADDPRVEQLGRTLVDWQWPDGGWNCDRSASGARSSFHETLTPMWGLYEFGAPWAREAADRAAELLLSHHLFRSTTTGEPIHAQWLRPRYPPYWHYDVLHALHVLDRAGKGDDPRTGEARQLVERRRRPDGRWAGGSWATAAQPDVVDWRRDGANEMLTLRALRATTRTSAA